MNKKLTGKAALVTGGSRGIGAAIARSLADDGADVAISYVSSPDKAKALVRELQDKGVRAVAFQADQAKPDEVAALVNKVAEHFGHLDILVNNAGVFITGPVGEVNDEDVDAAVRHQRRRRERRGARSREAHDRRRPHHFDRLDGRGRRRRGRASPTTRRPRPRWRRTRAAGRAISGPKGITVNVVEPGPIDTDMNPGDGDFAKPQKAGTALGRYGRPEEVGATVAFLASKNAGFITGASIAVDGGYSA